MTMGLHSISSIPLDDYQYHPAMRTDAGAGFEYPVRIPLEDALKDLRVGCSNCSRPAPLTPRQIEEQGLPFGWQLRLIHTRVAGGDAITWDLYCHACAGEASPRPPSSIRLSSHQETGDA